MYAPRKTLRPSWSAFLVLESEHAAVIILIRNMTQIVIIFYGEKDLIHYKDSLEVQIISSTCRCSNELLTVLYTGLACPLRASAQCKL